jgi:eukaryotic-like serine/threonine-protein kinase
LLCSRCGYTNKEGSRFCIKCGQQLRGASGNISISTGLGTGSFLQGRYRIIKRIGKGGMGVVYLANDNRFANRLCVIKEMLESLVGDNQMEMDKGLERFHQEGELLASINHANIPQVFDRFKEGSKHYLVMEFVEGIDLKELLVEHMSIYNKPLEEEAAVIYLMQLCLTLKYLHSHQPPILHRDIKPDNIILTKHGKVKLVDFGIAKTAQNSKGTSIGTQGYAAPEQYKGFADIRTDIYALGATLHHLLTGRDPQLEAPFDYPPVKQFRESISEDLSDIIEWMLQTNADSRPNCIDVVINAVRASYRDMDQRMLSYPLTNDKVIDIINRKLSAKNNTEEKYQCRNCGHENKAVSRFCIKCGNSLNR